MLGWGIYIYQKRPGESIETATSKEKEDKNLLAWWMTGYKGIDWLWKLTLEEKKGESLGGSGYPYRFTADAKIILPLIAQGLPPQETAPVVGEDYVLPRNWDGTRAAINRTLIEQCKPDDELVIEAWDQS